ncbi:MAG: xanthine dehydrogenase family protein subunit M [Syntrophobacteraceae bacterium]|jgi:carbon-monoxide dehydrogenase medium subunit
MKDVKYFAASNLEEAKALLSEYGCRAAVLAGGTDLVPKINYYKCIPDVFVYIGGLPLDYVKEEGDEILIGACTPTVELLASKLLAEKTPALLEAARSIGSEAIRTKATIGGNLVNASPAADFATPLLAMDANVKLESAGLARTMPLKDFFQGPGQTALKDEELLTEIAIPVPPGRTAFLKLGRRKALTLSIMNVAARVVQNGGTVQTVRIAVGAMAPVPMRCTVAESMLAGKKLEQKLIEECAERAISETSPIDDQRATAWYRRQAGKAMVARALGLAAGLSS